MKVKRIKKINILHQEFKVVWDKTHDGGSFSYRDRKITIGVSGGREDHIFMVVCHELLEMASVEMCVRFQRPDCSEDYLFSYDHRQHEAIASIFSGLITQFIE